MTPKVAKPLPECRVCERPMGRAAWFAQGGECLDCQAAQRRAAAQLSLPTDGDAW